MGKTNKTFTKNYYKKWPDKEKEEKVWEKLVLKDTPENPIKKLLKESPNQLLEDSQEEEVLKESLTSSMKILDTFLNHSLKTLLETLLHILNTLEEKPSLLWMLFMPSKDKAEPSMDSVDDFN